MAQNIEIGKIGEKAANNYLIKNGIDILINNYLMKWGEIDIIGKERDKTLIFFEVKTMIKKSAFKLTLKPEDNLTFQKRRKFQRICEFFVRSHPNLIDEDAGWRMDLLAIDLDEEWRPVVIRHYENI